MSYEKIKYIALKLIPKSILIGQEEYFRRLIFLFHKGNNYQCPVCEKKIKSFIHLAGGDELCPYCGSAARHRRLWALLKPMLTPGISVLDFSPPRCLYRKLSKMPGIAYTSTDFAGEFLAAKNLDITQLEVENNSYDIIICYHILEHVEKDMNAMHEMYRVLKRPGLCFVQTPFKEGEMYENNAVKGPKERKEHFDQEDHVRIYSVEGLTKRLSLAGFKVEQKHFSEKGNNYYGFRQNENVLIARKN